MNNVLVGIVIIPGVIALLLLAVFSFLYRQTRDPYFRAWQWGWFAYSAHYVFQAWNFYVQRNLATAWLADFSLGVMAWSVLRSTRLVRQRQPLRWFDAALLGAAAGWSTVDALFGTMSAVPRMLTVSRWRVPLLEIEVGVAIVLVVASYRFFQHGQRKNSTGFRLLALAIGFWSLLLLLVPFHGLLQGTLAAAGHFLGPLPQMLLGIAQVVVLFERERRSVQENLLAFSVLEVDTSRVLTAAEAAPGMQKLLERLLRVLELERGALFLGDAWRAALPSVHKGFSAGFLQELEEDRIPDFLVELAGRSGGVATLRDLEEPSLLLQEHVGSFERMRQRLQAERIQGITVANLQTRERCFGCVLLPNHNGANLGASQLRLLLGLSMQMALTLENYVLMRDAFRRTKEYELLTQIGQVISSHLDPDEVLLAFQRELGQLFDTSNMYVAFLDGELVRFELEVIANQVQPKRTRPAANMLTEYVIKTGRPLLVNSELEKVRLKLGCAPPPDPAKSVAIVPIVMYGRPTGVMAALNFEREFVYTDRDVEVLTTAAGQVAVAMENARLFSEEQRRSRYLAFLNNISKTAISSQHAEPMLEEIVSEIQKNFRFDHIGIGILDYATKDIEIKAEAGTTMRAVGRRVPLGAGILGRVARSNEMALIQNSDEERLGSLLDDARSVLCIPITYGETLLGVLNVESRRNDAFGQQEVLILRTLADLLATALHNAFVFQKLQQQAITDGLTGIKTRRFFVEALQSEWKRASRSGRAFSVVLMDLDKFKSVNDTMGHLEGDLVLARVGRLLEQKCRQSNVVARYGGDEFVILMPETALEQAQVLSERLRLWVATDPMLNERHVTGSFGVATFPLHGATAEEVLRVADAGMYASKHAGGNNVATVEEFRRRFRLAAADGFGLHRGLPAARALRAGAGGRAGAASAEAGGERRRSGQRSAHRRGPDAGARRRKPRDPCFRARGNRGPHCRGAGARYRPDYRRTARPDLCRPRARCGQDPDPGTHPQQGRATDAGRALPAEDARQHRGGDCRHHSRRRAHPAVRAPPPRARRRHRVSRQPARRANPHGGAHPGHRRGLQQHDARPAVCPRAEPRRGGAGAGARQRHPVRRHAGAAAAARTQRRTRGAAGTVRAVSSF